jgi:hypothetical protein
MMSDEHFCVLSSRENKKQFPENNASGFTNIIRSPLELGSEYIVGLHKLIYKPKYLAISGNDPRYYIELRIDASLEIQEPTKLLVDNTFYFKFIFQTDIYYSSGVSLIDNINQQFMNFLTDKMFIDNSHPSIFQLNINNQHILFNHIKPRFRYNLKPARTVNYKIEWTFSEEMGKILGVDHLKTYQPHFIKAISIPKEFDCLFIYSDIVSESYIGGKTVNILDIVPAETMTIKESSIPLYKPVSNVNFNSLSIKISDENGNKVDFHESVNVLIVLHIKKIE